MKTQSKVLVVLLAIFTVTQAQAMRWYSPSTGNWFSRDPFGEPGFNLLRGSKSVDHEMDHLLQVGLESLRKRDRVAFSMWLKELSIRQEIQQKPYHNADFVRSGGDSANPYAFNQNDGINQIDSLGLISFTVTYPCVNPCCKYWLFCSITVDKPNRFPRKPILLAVCLQTALNDLNLSCGLCRYSAFEAACARATRCFQFNW